MENPNFTVIMGTEGEGKASNGHTSPGDSCLRDFYSPWEDVILLPVVSSGQKLKEKKMSLTGHSKKKVDITFWLYLHFNSTHQINSEN